MDNQPIIDASVLRGLVEIAGDQPQALLEELFTLLLESGEVQAATIRTAAPDDFNAITRAAHTLKGAAGSVHATHVARIAGQIDSQARLLQLGPWQNMADELQHALARLRDAAIALGYYAAAKAV